MQSKLLHEEAGQRTFALIFETGDEVMASLEGFAQAQRLSASHFTAIGALSDLTVAWYDTQANRYKPIPINEQVEVLTMAGDIALKNDRPAIHAHIVVGKSDGTAHGGHLQKAHVRPTLELILTESPAHLRKHTDPRTGLALIQINESL